MKTPIAALTVALAAALVTAPPSRADTPSFPSNSARIGMYYITYHSSADDISGPFVPAGLNLKLEATTTLYLAYVRSLSEHFSVELAFGIPPKTKTKGVGPTYLGLVPGSGLYNNQEISSAKWLSPTLLLEYTFFDESSALRPYVGVGVNHTIFYDRVSTAAGNAASGGPTSVSLPSSTGIAGTIGLSYRISGAWHVYASFSASKVSSDLTATTAGIARTSHIDFGPRAYVISAGYSF